MKIKELPCHLLQLAKNEQRKILIKDGRYPNEIDRMIDSMDEFEIKDFQYALPYKIYKQLIDAT